MTGCVFGGADIYSYEQIHIPEDAVIAAADGGYRHCVRLGVAPDIIAGDFDSIDVPADMLPCANIIHAPREKDDTDLMLCIRALIEGNCSVIRLYGADGGRMGHTLAAFGALAFIEDHGVEGVIYGNGFEARIQSKGVKSYCDSGFAYLSVFSVTDSSRIILSGLKYSGRITLTSVFPKGVSNEFSEKNCSIEVISGKILIIFEK